ncbi:AhpC/TSA family protein-like protein [Aaosphaeria arxii CBS 175.79]|uniref:AhpC/TSA family protein-like protein n=1 Tax=Aaosphaeria arxii CBS 175.79 TaxID=1450172 RepID=A0A6A5XWW8_9PLEO|nr:AhpC/TSA family protein-like protein [Aaosphaeria arxii CBS 175.79]KAF2017446.1 AhpC/TSA family protein-like protein [Aaosphaeria arxii CBS 175.79]
MAPLQVGDGFPEGVKFDWVPIIDSDPKTCGRPQEYDASKEWKGKKVVLFSVPGAFTPSCQANHLPGYIAKLGEFKSKGVDVVAVIASNDAWVMNAWGKINGIQGDDILFLSDTKSGLSKNHGWSAGPDRNGRWAIAIGTDGKIVYADHEESPGQVTVSGADAVLAKL